MVRRTNNGATTKEARLEHDSEVLAGKASEMEPALEQILGLDFDRFTKTVVLPQGRFAAFLHDKPADRQELLRQLLDLGIYGRMGGQARQRANTAKDKLEVLEPRLVADVPSEEQIAQLAEAFRDAVTAGQGTLDHLLNDLDRSTEVAARARDQAEGLAVLLLAVTGVDVPQQVLALGDELQQATTAFSGAEKALGEACAKGPRSRTGRKRRSQCRNVQDSDCQHRQLAKLEEQVAGLDDQCDSAVEQHRTATEQASAIRVRLELLKVAVAEASTAAQAAQQAVAERFRLNAN